MPSSRQLIASNVLTTATNTVSFSAIPSTYTDLILRMSLRGSNFAQIYDNITLRFNSTNNDYSGTRLNGDGAAASSDRTSNATNLRIINFSAGSSATASTFSNAEIYIPNYNTSTSKVVSGTGTGENNATTSYITAIAGLWGQTAAINEVQIFANTSTNFVTGSSFYLYGIKSSGTV